MELELPSPVRSHHPLAPAVADHAPTPSKPPPPKGSMDYYLLKVEHFVSVIVFASRWLQAPLYLGLVVAQAIYVIVFLRQLVTLIMGAGGIEDENKVMLTVLGMIDVVMISNLLIMVIVGGYQTFVAKLGIDKHPDRPEWLAHINENTLKIKLALSLIGISSIHLLRSFIDAEHVTSNAVYWQVVIHCVFLISASAIAFAVWLAHKGTSVQMDHHQPHH